MKNREPLIAKITRPKIAGILERPRLFSLLDKAAEKGMVWISGLAGSGKTTLAASWLDSRRLPCIWYQLDEGDSDPAAFFYHMGSAARKAAPRRRKPLPLLTPEYLQGSSMFARQFFENLYRRLKRPFAIVFDNYHDVPEASAFHDMIMHGLAAVPEGIRLLVLSRSGPPESFSRLRADDRMSFIAWEDLRLTLEEAEKMVSLRHGKVPKECLSSLFEKTHGWAAGLVLCLEQRITSGATREFTKDFSPGAVFDYFASEIFRRLDPGTQLFLLKSAFLQRMHAGDVEALTGEGRGAHILHDLNRKNYFTYRLSPHDPVYQYHPLFHEFLMNRARATFSAAELRGLMRGAAALLEERGVIENAASLFQEARDWKGAERLVLKNARSLLEQGRGQTLEKWLRNFPPDVLASHPWLMFWLGACRTPFDLRESRNCLERAYALFRQNREVAGTYLSWAAVVETFVYEWSDFHPLDRWIAEADILLREHPHVPSPEIEARFVSALFCGLMYRQPHHPGLPFWEERVRRVIFSLEDINLKLAIGSHLVLYYTWWNGEQSKAMVLMNTLRPEVRPTGINPLAKIVWRAIEAACSWMSGDNEACMAAAKDGLRIAEETGVHLWDFMLLAQQSFGTLTAGELDAARACHQRMEFIFGSGRKLDIAHYHYHLGWEAMCRRNFRLALEHMETGLKTAEEAGEPFIAAFIRMGAAEALIELGNHKTAKAYLDEAYGVGLEMKSNTIKYQYLWLEAMRGFASGDEPGGLNSLAGHLAVSRENGILNHAAWRSSVMTPLYAKALEAGVEVEHVQRIIRTRRLAPEYHRRSAEEGGTGRIWAEHWPWPVKVYTLGGFELAVEDRAVTFSGKTQKKPIELLKALIAFGGKDVPEDLLNDALWPDAAGDAAHSAFTTTISRLRLLLGMDEAIAVSGGKISLDPRYCWVDAWEFEKLEQAIQASRSGEPANRRIGKIEQTKQTGQIKTDGNAVASLQKKALQLYRGAFFTSDLKAPWTVSMRERLRNRFLRLVIAAGDSHEQEGEWDEAARCYMRAVDIDDHSEELHQRVMNCHLKLGRNAEAVAAYRRCKRTLLSAFGIAPSEKTEALYRSAL